jgi:hypothetical protein
MIDYPRIQAIWFQRVFQSGTWSRQVVVETSLVLDSAHRKYDAAEVAKLGQAVEVFMRAISSSLHTAIIRPWRPNI